MFDCTVRYAAGEYICVSNYMGVSSEISLIGLGRGSI